MAANRRRRIDRRAGSGMMARMGPYRWIVAAISVAGLAACASTATRLPDISETDLRAESIVQETRALAVQAAHAERLMKVGRQVLRANAELCPKTRRNIGVLVHSEDSYPKEMRIAARRELGATRDPSVMRVVAGGPAARAGVRPGDVFLLDGRPADPRDKAFRERLDPAQVALDIRRGDEDLTLTVQPETVCRSQLRLRPSTEINALADGRNITVTTGMMDFTQSDDELALIVGHELAHNTMGHIRKVVGNFLLSGFATRYTRPFESEADYVGLYYMVRAGFDPDDVEAFWRRLADVDPRSVNRAKTHPTFPDRYLRIAAARDEIRAKQAANAPLVPNFKAGDE
ncbi:M48 family metallopeptidase [uncultured Algimonas sp.]|uniref:M48 family metallopeptidase n=1 Tax=uncultured Algimonas sp. TaxID=1547920 RepID=UPI0026163A9A|nr:M48 family metallopeptidase [uncultured Algimonas sp.]